ncbi:hypothetical protein BS17DRAFT_306456 [Gyrodon lividus]|nr:hypothetical protein BS17DRAFT_306456 [Gyrodon lividus]
MSSTPGCLHSIQSICLLRPSSRCIPHVFNKLMGPSRSYRSSTKERINDCLYFRHLTPRSLQRIAGSTVAVLTFAAPRQLEFHLESFAVISD